MACRRLFNVEVVSFTVQQQRANVQLHRRVCASNMLKPTCLHTLSISTLNDGLFLNSPWLMMHNPKIPSNIVFVLSHSWATSFHSCLPSFTLTGSACLPPWCQQGWRRLTSVPLTESQCKEAMRWRRTAKKGRVLSRLVVVLSHLLPPPPSCVYANSLCWRRTVNDTLLKIDGTISFCPSHKHYLSLLLSRGARSKTRIGN